MKPSDPNGTPESLHFESRGLDGRREGDPLLVLLHGRGSDEKDLLQLGTFLRDTGSVGPGPSILTPRAPFPGRPWGYGPGWAWYRYLSEDRMEPATLQASLASIDALMARLPAILDERTGPVILGGFSQGGTTALAWALTRPGRVHGVVNLSGFLANVPVVEDALAGNASGLSVFWGHGREDPNIPFDLAEKGRARLEESGASIEPFDHPSGHTITPGEMTALGRWLGEVLADD